MTYSQKPVTLTEIQSNLNYFSRYPNFLQFTGKEVFRLREKVNQYLLQPYASREEKQKAHGNLLWLLKNYYSTPFQKEAIILQNFNVKNFDLSDKDKLNYLNYILVMKTFTRFSPYFFKMLSHYNPESKGSAEQSGRVFHKMKTLLAKNYRKDENYQEIAFRFYPFLCEYAKHCPQVNNQMVDDYAQILFKMSAKFPLEQVSLMPLKDLMDNMTEQAARRAKIQNLFGDEFEPKQSLKPQIDKKLVKRVLAHYIVYSSEAEKKQNFDACLYSSIESMFGYIVENYDYKASDIKDLRRLLGHKHSGGNNQRRLYDLGLKIQQRFRQSQPVQMRKSKQADLFPTAMDYFYNH